MLFIFGNAEAKRLPGRFQVPWKAIMLAAIALIAFAGIYGANWIVSRVDENTSAPTAPTIMESLEPIAQPVQLAPVVGVAPVIPMVVDYRGALWGPVKDGFDPSTIPVEEGLYNGTMPQSITWSPSNPDDVPKGDAFAWKILPYLIEIGRGSQVAVARDQINKDIVLVSILPAALYQPYILLSVNGEKSWCMLNLLPIWASGYQQGDVHDLRVVAQSDEIHLYGQHPLGPRTDLYWWEAMVKKNELPCS